MSQEKSLDDLFLELRQATSGETTEEKDEFKKIQNQLSKLPKLQSALEQQEEGPKKTRDITKINDPIVVKHSKKEDDSAGANWFGLSRPELTPQIKRDLAIIQQRSALDPKRHYKKEKWQIPKYFATGTIIQGNTEYYSSRMLRRSRGQTLAEEILNDGDANKFFKRKYAEIQQQKTSGKKAHYKAVKERRKRY